MTVELSRSPAPTDDFLAVMAHLDDELAKLNGCQQQTYAGYNKPVGLALVVVAYDSGLPVAIGAYKVRDDSRAEIKRMFVEPSHRGRGLSRQVLAALEAAIAEAGLGSIVLETSRHFEAANGLYRNSGYRPIANFPPYQNLADSTCYQKDLP